MLHRIREGRKRSDDSGRFDGPGDVDETYFGGKRKYMSNAKRAELVGTGSGPVGKTAVMGAEDRAINQVAAKVVHAADRDTLQGFVPENTDPEVKVFTDEASAYKGPRRTLEAVKHYVSEYVCGHAPTIGVESFWAALKRAHEGMLHKLSPKHLIRYVSEFAGKHNIFNLDALAQMTALMAGLVGSV